MAVIYVTAGGIPCFSSDCTATPDFVLAGKTCIMNNSSDEVGTGVLPKKYVKVENGGTLCINSVLAF